MTTRQKIITIHFDFTDGSELSYIEAKNETKSFNTHCLDFFCFDTEADDVIVLKKDGTRISRKNIQQHVCNGKEIREAHNLHKLLRCGYFEFK